MKIKPALLHFKFDNFANLPSEPGESTLSEVQTDCNGHKWYLEVYPGGEPSDDEPGWISLYLHRGGNNCEELNVRTIIAVTDAYGATVEDYEDIDNEIFCIYSHRGKQEFIKRSVVLDSTNKILKNGALRIDVEIQVKDDKDDLFQPKNDHCSKMLALLESGKKTDASIMVGGKCFHVHSLIIDSNSPILASNMNGSIDNVHSDVFQLLLEYIYSGRVPSKENIIDHGRDLIDVANRYEMTGLKMSVENILVRERVMTKENVADYILFADAKCCPLLKEYAICYFLMYHKEVLKSEHSKCLRDSAALLSEIMLLMNNGNETDDGPKNVFEKMNVTALRKELDKRNHDVDGSKDALIFRLTEIKRKRREHLNELAKRQRTE